MIEVYSANATNFTKNGIATLIPEEAYTECELNGAWTATIVHPIDEEGRWKHLTEQAIVKMPSWNGDQLYRVVSRQKTDPYVICQLYPIFFDSMGDCFLVDVKTENVNGQQALNAMLQGSSKYFGRSNILKTATAYYEYVNIMEALAGDAENSFLKVWGGEVEYDDFTVIVNSHMGADNDLTMRYGLNIQEITEDIDMSGIITRVYPSAYNDRRSSSYVDSPVIGNYPTVRTATMTFDWIKTSGDATEEDEDDPAIIIAHNQEELDAALADAVNAEFDAGLDKPVVNITVNGVFDLSKIEGFEAWSRQPIGLGDTVHVINPKIDITTDARVIYLKYDSLREEVADIQIGSKPYDFFHAISDLQAKVESGGLDGAPGASVVASWIEWCQASARSIPAGGSFEDIQITQWELTLPTYAAGRFYWMRLVTEMSDGELIAGDPVFDLGSQVSAEAQVAATNAQTAAGDAQGIANQALGVAQGINNHFWYDNNGAHVSDTEGTVASGNSQTIAANGTVMMRNGKLVTSWTGSNSSNAALNFYDCSNAAASVSNLVASYSRSGVLQYVNNVLAMALTASGLTFFDITDAAHSGQASQRKEAVFGASGVSLYAEGEEVASFGKSKIEIGQENAEINFCKDRGLMYFDGSLLKIAANPIEQSSGTKKSEVEICAAYNKSTWENRSAIRLIAQRLYNGNISGSVDVFAELEFRVFLRDELALSLSNGNFILDVNTRLVPGSPSPGTILLKNVSYISVNGVQAIDSNGVAVKATSDGSGNNIASTYVKGTTTANRVLIGNGTRTVKSLAAGTSGNVLKSNGSGSDPSWGTLSASDVGAVPTSRTVNGKALSSNITLGASDVSASQIKYQDTTITGQGLSYAIIEKPFTPAVLVGAYFRRSDMAYYVVGINRRTARQYTIQFNTNIPNGTTLNIQYIWATDPVAV